MNRGEAVDSSCWPQFKCRTYHCGAMDGMVVPHEILDGIESIRKGTCFYIRGDIIDILTEDILIHRFSGDLPPLSWVLDRPKNMRREHGVACLNGHDQADLC